jgi:hypothetical protein
MAIKCKQAWHLAGILLLAVCSCANAQAPAIPAFVPVKDDAKLPRVLLIGDSISIGYTLPVRQLLNHKANVHRIPDNGEYSAYGLAHIKEWLGDGKWDVIHFNWGIWDTHLVDSHGELVPNQDEYDGKARIRTTIAEYQENLNKLIDILGTTKAKLIWASSTPVTSRKGERLEDMGKYNKAAAEVMNSRHVMIDDLYSVIEPHLSEMQGDDGCHFTLQGYEYLGRQVAATISATLPAESEKQ